jgi:hypothetical protein
MGEGDGGLRMKTRKSALCALGLAAAITLGGAASAAAQVTDTTGRARSQTRIPIRKDQGQAAAVTRTDTVTITRTDTVIMRRTDTVTVQRTDTVTRVEELPLQPLKSFQFGLGVGMDVPLAAWLGVAKLAPTGHAHLGFFPGAGPIGLRLDGDYTAFGSRETDCPNCSSTKLISGSANLVLRIPLDRKSPINPQIYFLGGGGIDKFSDFVPYRAGERGTSIVTAGKDTYLSYPGLALTAAQAGDESMFYHWDVGGGFQLGRFFMEAKYHSINTNGENSAHIPIVLGINF